jgi:hypothetical protein
MFDVVLLRLAVPFGVELVHFHSYFFELLDIVSLINLAEPSATQ